MTEVEFPSKMRDGRARRVGLALVLGTALISGVSIPLNGIALGNVGTNASVFTGLKNLLVGMVFVAILQATREVRTLRTLPRLDWLRLVGIGILGGSIPFLLFFQALAMLNAAEVGGALASFFHKTMFLFVAVLAFVFLRERLEKWLFVAAILLLAGTFIMLTPALAGPALPYGLVLLATAFWAGEITLSKSTLRRLGANVVVAARMGFGAGFILVYLAATGQVGQMAGLGVLQWQWVLVTVGFLVAYQGTFYHGLKRIDATSATSILVLGAALSLAVNLALQGVAITPLQATGMLLILLGVVAGMVRAMRHVEADVREPVPRPA